MESYFFVILVAQSHKMTFLHYNRKSLCRVGGHSFIQDADRNDAVRVRERALNGFGLCSFKFNSFAICRFHSFLFHILIYFSWCQPGTRTFWSVHHLRTFGFFFFFLVKYCSKSHYSLHLCSSCSRRHKHIHTRTQNYSIHAIEFIEMS